MPSGAVPQLIFCLPALTRGEVDAIATKHSAPDRRGAPPRPSWAGKACLLEMAADIPEPPKQELRAKGKHSRRARRPIPKGGDKWRAVRLARRSFPRVLAADGG